MLSRTWFAAIAFGLICTFTCAYSQEAPKQKPEGGKEYQGRDNANYPNNAQPKLSIPTELLSVLSNIETAIRESKAKEDKAEEERKTKREEADLKAQQDMVFWAEKMYWAAIAAAIIAFLGIGATCVGIYLVWKTLGETKRAAIAAEEMVSQSKDATKSAQDAAKSAWETVGIMRDESRPWLVIDSDLRGYFSFDKLEDDFLGRLKVNWGMRYNAVNKGKSAGHRYQFVTKVVCCDDWIEAENQFLQFVDHGNHRWKRSFGPLFSGEKSDFNRHYNFEVIQKQSSSSKAFAVFILLKYTDASGSIKGLDARCYILQQMGASIGPWINEFRNVPDVRITR